MGIVSDVNPVHSKKAASPMEVTELGMVNDVKLRQAVKVYLSMDVTELGIVTVTEVKAWHW